MLIKKECTGKADEDCRFYVGDIVLLREDFVSRMKWRNEIS